MTFLIFFHFWDIWKIGSVVWFFLCLRSIARILSIEFLDGTKKVQPFKIIFKNFNFWGSFQKLWDPTALLKIYLHLRKIFLPVGKIFLWGQKNIFFSQLEKYFFDEPWKYFHGRYKNIFTSQKNIFSGQKKIFANIHTIFPRTLETQRPF